MTADIWFGIGGFVALVGGVVAYLVHRYRADYDPPPPGLEQAVRLIWDSWGMPWDRRPTIIPMRQRHLDGPDGRTFRGASAEWVYGESHAFGQSAECTIAFPDGVTISQTALAFEMRRAKRGLEVPGAWAEPDGYVMGLADFMADVAAANNLLRSKGL